VTVELTPARGGTDLVLAVANLTCGFVLDQYLKAA